MHLVYFVSIELRCVLHPNLRSCLIQLQLMQQLSPELIPPLAEANSDIAEPEDFESHQHFRENVALLIRKSVPINKLEKLP